MTEIKDYKAVTDEDLIEGFQEGDTQCFTEIVHRYKDPLFNFVARMLKDRSFAEDIVQETFVRVYRNRHRYQRIARFSTWIYTIAINLTKTELKRQSLRRYFSLSAYEDGKQIELPDHKVNLEKGAEDRITNENIQAAIAKLPKNFREAVALRDIQELSYDEISKALNIPLGTVKSRVNRGRTRLQKMLKDFYQKKNK